MSAPPENQYYGHHIFFCLNKRDNGEACCADHHAQEAFDRCQGGPIAVVYPEGTWYTYVDANDIDEIVESHLRDGKVVERLLTPPHLGR